MDEEYDGDFNECLNLLEKLSKEEILGILREADIVCGDCHTRLKSRIRNYLNSKFAKSPVPKGGNESSEEFWSSNSSSTTSTRLNPKAPYWGPEPVHSRRGYANVAQSPVSVTSKVSQYSSPQVKTDSDGLSLVDEEEQYRIAMVGRKKDFNYIEKVGGVRTNVIKGLELHTEVFNIDEQKKIVDCVYSLQRMGQHGQLRERTYLEPKKWMRGKGRVTIQFGCCYNYAKDKYGNPPGISRDDEVDPLPPLFKEMIKRMVRWNVLPPTCVPDSCIVNIYNAGDCIPPHIDHHDFLRPFCTVSFLSECRILFGTSLKVLDEGEFDGPVSVPLPLGSVLILSGNGADVAKHCVPSVPAKRISITFRKMDSRKLPYRYLPDPELIGASPLVNSSSSNSRIQQSQPQDEKRSHDDTTPVVPKRAEAVFNKEDDFPTLGSSKYSRRRW